MSFIRIPDNGGAYSTHIYVPTASVTSVCVVGPISSNYNTTVTNSGDFAGSHVVFTGSQAAAEGRADAIALAVGLDVDASV